MQKITIESTNEDGRQQLTTFSGELIREHQDERRVRFGGVLHCLHFTWRIYRTKGDRIIVHTYQRNVDGRWNGDVDSYPSLLALREHQERSPDAPGALFDHAFRDLVRSLSEASEASEG